MVESNMITYEYLCHNCSLRFEEERSIEQREMPTILPCPRCQEYEVRKLVSLGNFVLLGRGWGADGYSNNVAEVYKKEWGLTDREIRNK